MSGARGRLANQNDSGSLWNYTDSPGWTKQYTHVLRLALIRYSCGNWKDIARHFPFKNHNQLNTQSQILFGQQSLHEFASLHVDPNIIRRYNETVRFQANRKNSVIVGTTAKTRADKIALREMHELLNSIPPNIATKIHVPVLNFYPQNYENIGDKINKYQQLFNVMKCCEQEIKKRKDGKRSTNVFTVETYVNADIVQKSVNERKVRREHLMKSVPKFRESLSWMEYHRNMGRDEIVDDVGSDKLMIISENESKVNEDNVVSETVDLEMKMNAMNVVSNEMQKQKKVKNKKRRSKKRKYQKGNQDEDEDYKPPPTKKAKKLAK